MLPTTPPETIEEYKALNKLLFQKERQYKAFDLLVKSLAGAYWHATGEHPTTSYSESDAQGHGAFWRMVELVLPVASEIALGAGVALGATAALLYLLREAPTRNIPMCVSVAPGRSGAAL